MAKVLGILGGGQLGQMIAEAAESVGVRVICYDPSSEACAASHAQVVTGGYDQFNKLEEFCNAVDCVGLEFENIPLSAAEFVKKLKPLYPSIRALAVCQDRLEEKQFFENQGISTNKFYPVSSLRELKDSLEKIGYPAVLKTRRLGYDGKGQWRINGDHDVESAWKDLGSVPCLLEAFVPIELETSCIAVRSLNGEVLFYPPGMNVHEGGILKKSIVPVPLSKVTIEKMHTAARIVGEKLEMVGVFAVEFFITKSGEILAGEIAPRVHNTGHWTQDGAKTSQFENHVRALLGMELASTQCLGPTVMFNIIGKHPDWNKLKAVPGIKIHNYKKTAKPGRKLAHCNLTTAQGQTSIDQSIVLDIEEILS